VVSVLLDEDFIVNSPNIYESCESFTANFSSHGANATISTTHVHNGTNAVKIDNSLATGGTNDYVMLGFWPTNVALQSGRFAVSSWSYVTANDSQVAFSVKDGTAIFSSGPARVQVDIWGSNSNHVEWFNNSTWQDTGTAAAQNTWNKMTMAGNAQPTTVTGGNVRLNNATLTPSLGQDQTGAAPRFFQAQGASTGSTHNVIFWLDDVYTHQYTANPPLVTAGTEQTFSAPPTFTAPSSGAASLAALISAGVSQFTASASGAASLVALAAAGTGSFLAPGAGAAALVPLIAAGAGAFTARGTGAASLVSLVTAGAGSFMATGSGAASLVTLVAAGSGTAAGGAGSTLAVYPDPFGSTVVMTVDPFGSTAKLKGN
jgi:hypothetical protein